MVDSREYHERTNHSPRKLREGEFSLDWENEPRSFKAYRDLEHEDLGGIDATQHPALSAIAEPRADPTAAAGAGEASDLDRRALATLCYEAAGIVHNVTGEDGREHRFRAASCTGNLHHVDLYPVCGDLGELPAGVYHFDPETMALDLLREGDFRDALAAAAGDHGSGVAEGRDGDAAADEARAETGVATAPVTFVVTSTWWRNAWKYRERTYRHAFWDSGTILANLLASAHAGEHRAEVVTGFVDESVAELIGVDPENEAPLELVPVGTDDPAPEPPDVEQIDPDTEPLSPDPVDYPLIHDAWDGSALADGDAVREWRRNARRSLGAGTVAGGDGERVPLEPVDAETASARPLHATVRRRGSCREYAEEGPSRRQVGTVLDRATRGVPADWNGGGADGLAFNDAYVLATGVDGVPDGSYQFHPEEATLERIGDATREDKRHLALGQDWAGDAHVNVYLLADVDAVVDRLGNRGYRLAQLEAGITLGRLYLATYAHRDLGGLGLTFFDDAVAEQFDDRTDGGQPTCLFAFGRAAK